MVSVILAIIYALIIVFAILGISDFIFFLKLSFWSPKKSNCDYILITLDKYDYKLQIYSALQKKNWYGDAYCNSIIAVTKNLNENEIEELKKSYRSNDIIFCNDLKTFDSILPYGEETDA